MGVFMKTKSFIAFALLMTFATSTFARQERECRYFSTTDNTTLGTELLFDKGVELAPDANSADIIINVGYFWGAKCGLITCKGATTGEAAAYVRIGGKFVEVANDVKEGSKTTISSIQVDSTPQVKKAFNSVFKKVKKHKCYEEIEIDQSGREVSGDKSSSSKSSSKKSNASAQ